MEEVDLADFEDDFSEDDAMQELLAQEQETHPFGYDMKSTAKRLNFDLEEGSEPSASQQRPPIDEIALSDMDLSPDTFGTTTSDQHQREGDVQMILTDPNVTHSENEVKQAELLSIPPEAGMAGVSGKRPRPLDDFDPWNHDATSSLPDGGRVSQPRKKRCVDKPKTTSRYVFDRAPIGASMSITADNGDRYYLKMQSTASVDQEMRDYKRSKNRSGSVLHTPVFKLMELISKEKEEKEQQERRAAVERKEVEVVEQPAPVVQNELWVEKYAPKKFIELLSDEKVNRDVLGWVKKWDEVVFGEKINAAKRKKRKRLQPVFLNKIPTIPKVGPGGKNADVPEIDKRPDQKVILLCGPPGTGKTTLAHIAAIHSGYDVIEINASDDRSAKVLSERIKTAVENGSVFTGKPNLIVLDEIDGAEGGQDSRNAISSLLKIVGQQKKLPDPPPLANQQEKKKKKIKVRRSNRPIICICNDQYSSALRPLREAGLVFTFNPPQKSSLCQRLQHICRKEKIQADIRTLSELAENAENDIRSCLNTLQFLKNRASAAQPSQKYTKLTSNMISSVSFGRKDITKGLFQAWEVVFCKPRSSSKRSSRTKKAARDAARILYSSDITEGQSAKQIQWLYLRNIISSQDLEKVIQGIHENFPLVSYADPTFRKTNEVVDWLCYADLFSSYVRRHQNYGFYGYIPFAGIAVHEAISSDRLFRPKYPKIDWQMRSGIQQNRSVLEAFMMGPPSANDDGEGRSSNLGRGAGEGLRKFLSTSVAILEVFPYLANIVAPPLKSVPIHKMEDSQRQMVEGLVDMMISYNLDFKQNYNSLGENKRQLYPDITQVVNFQKQPEWQHRQERGSSYSNFKSYVDEGNESTEYKGAENSLQNLHRDLSEQTKEILSHQIELEKMRRLERSSRDRSSSPPPSISGSFSSPLRSNRSMRGSTLTPQKRSMFGTSSTTTPQRKTAVSKVPKKTPKGTGQFGAKKRLSDAPEPSKSPARGVTFMSKHQKPKIERVFYPIHFEFVEGYTCAVRRKVFIKEFI